MSIPNNSFILDSYKDEKGNYLNYQQQAYNIEGGGKVSVGTTAVEITFTDKTKSITITADFSNSGYIYVGKSNVTSAGANAFAVLDAGDTIIIDYNDASNPIYCVASVVSQNIWKGATV